MSARIDDALVQEVRDRTDIVQVVADYVSLKKAGTHLKGLCPFHNEKTPSFTVHPGRQFYYCFGCQTGGDAISFLREIQGLSFVEAVRQLADRAGIAIPEPRLERHDASHGRGSADRGGAPRTSRAGREALFGVGREAQRFFAEQLQTMAGQRCRDYLRERGIEAAAIERFGLGFAPASWDGLVGHLVGRREDLAIAVQAGLLGAKKSGRGYYDRFRDRLMFPIRSLGGEVVAFGGRILPSSTDDPEAAKYINSPDTPVYDKGRTLFGLYEARRAMRSAGHAVLVEGNLDVVRLSQAGIENVVAPMGTALTPEQCRLARRFVPRLILVLDGDRAGRAAAEKAVPAALAEGLAVGVVSLPVGEDPDSFVGRHGADALRAEIDNAVEGWDFLVEATVGAMAGRDGRIAGLGDAIAALAPVLAGISNRGERLLYQRRLAGRVGVDDAALAELLGSVRPGRRAPQEPARPAARAQPLPPRAECELVLLMLTEPTVRPLYWARDAGRLVTSRAARVALERLASASEEEDAGVDPAGFVAEVPHAGLRDMLFRALGESVEEESGAVRFERLLSELRCGDLDRRKQALTRRLEAAIRVGDEEQQLRIVSEKKKLVREIETIRGSRGGRWPS